MKRQKFSWKSYDRSLESSTGGPPLQHSGTHQCKLAAGHIVHSAGHWTGTCHKHNFGRMEWDRQHWCTPWTREKNMLGLVTMKDRRRTVFRKVTTTWEKRRHRDEYTNFLYLKNNNPINRVLINRLFKKIRNWIWNHLNRLRDKFIHRILILFTS